MKIQILLLQSYDWGKEYHYRTMQIQDQTAPSVQSDLDLHYPIKNLELRLANFGFKRNIQTHTVNQGNVQTANKISFVFCHIKQIALILVSLKFSFTFAIYLVVSKVLLSLNELREWRFVTMVNDVINLSDCIETMTVVGSYFERKFHDANISYFSNVSICLPLFMKDMFSLFLSLHK